MRSGRDIGKYLITPGSCADLLFLVFLLKIDVSPHFLGYSFGSWSWWLWSSSLAVLFLGKHPSHFSLVQVLPTWMLSSMTSVACGLRSLHQLGLRHSGPCWTRHTLTGSPAAPLSPHCPFRILVGLIDLWLWNAWAGLLASTCTPAGSLSTCVFLGPQDCVSHLLNCGCPCFCHSELGAATIAAVTGALWGANLYQWPRPLGLSICAVLGWF